MRFTDADKRTLFAHFIRSTGLAATSSYWITLSVNHCACPFLLHSLGSTTSICMHRFEDVLARKWSSEKRFGLEGCEVLWVECWSMKRKKLCSAAASVFTFCYICRVQAMSSTTLGCTMRGLAAKPTRTSHSHSWQTRPSTFSLLWIQEGKTKAEQFYRGEVEGRKLPQIGWLLCVLTTSHYKVIIF